MSTTPEELLALDALGVLSDEEARELASLRSRDADIEQEALAYSEASALIAVSLEKVEPPAAVRMALMASFRPPAVVRASEAAWRSMFTGVEVRKVQSDRARRTVTSLLRIAPGAVYPGHSHKGAEESFVVSGSCRFGAIALVQGDFIRIEAGGGHGDVTTEEGCVLLVISDWDDVAA